MRLDRTRLYFTVPDCNTIVSLSLFSLPLLTEDYMQGYYNSLVFNLLACAQRREEASAGLHVEAAAFPRYDSVAMRNPRNTIVMRQSTRLSIRPKYSQNPCG